MSESHSIWLMPAASDLAFFEETVGRVAEQFGTTVFCPHLTLVEDMRRPADELGRLLEEVVSGRNAFRCPIDNVVGTTLFYRSLYVVFYPNEDLLTLKKRAISAFDEGDIANFTPHISLGYGVEPSEEKHAAIATLAKQFKARIVTFDSVVVAASAQSIPIDQWKIVSRHGLRGSV